MASENTRELVLDMLLCIEKEEEYSHKLIRQVLDKYGYLEEKDRSFIKRLFEGTLERRLELDYHIDRYASVRVSRMKPLIRNLMRMSVYQILYMDGVPDSAAVNEAVKLAQKRKFQNLKGFINAVLRKIAGEKEKLTFPDREKEPKAFLSVRYSMPEWIVELFSSHYSPEETEKLLECFQRVRPVTIRFRRDLPDEEKEQLLTKMQDLGMQITVHPLVKEAYLVENCAGIEELPGFSEGKMTVQDTSSMLAVMAAGITPGMRVLDICAAPGGKAILAAEYAKEAELVEARDISEAKLSLIAENCGRMHCESMKKKIWDASCPDESAVESADVVLADLPCSGLGVMGKKRDIRYRQTKENTESLSALQKTILKNAAAYVKPGGILLYSTCTMNPAENEENVAWFTENFNFHTESLRPYLPDTIAGEDLEKGYLQLLPHKHDTDGFFFARLRRD